MLRFQVKDCDTHFEIREVEDKPQTSMSYLRTFYVTTPIKYTLDDLLNFYGSLGYRTFRMGEAIQRFLRSREQVPKLFPENRVNYGYGDMVEEGYQIDDLFEVVAVDGSHIKVKTLQSLEISIPQGPKITEHGIIKGDVSGWFHCGNISGLTREVADTHIGYQGFWLNESSSAFDCYLSNCRLVNAHALSSSIEGSYLCGKYKKGIQLRIEGSNINGSYLTLSADSSVHGSEIRDSDFNYVDRTTIRRSLIRGTWAKNCASIDIRNSTLANSVLELEPIKAVERKAHISIRDSWLHTCEVFDDSHLLSIRANNLSCSNSFLYRMAIPNDCHVINSTLKDCTFRSSGMKISERKLYKQKV